MKRIVFLFSFLSIQLTAFSQLGVGTNSPDASAQLDVTASDKGFLAPRIALTGATDVATIASPATGLMIYNTATAGTAPNNVLPGYYYFDGVKWVRFINSQPSAIVSFDTTDPNTGSTLFTPNTPQSTDFIYVSDTNSSLWTWNGAAYVTYTTPESTPFYVSGTTNDAGSNKTSNIYRIGSVGIGTSDPYTKLDVNGNIFTSIHGSSSLQNVLEQTSRFIGHKSGNTNDGFTGIENEVGAYGSSGSGNGSKIHFLTWGSNISASRRVMTINQQGNVGIDNTSPTINFSVGSSNLSQKMGRAIINANSLHHADKRDAFQIGRWDGASGGQVEFLGINFNVSNGVTVGEGYDNQSFLTFHTWGSNIANSTERMRLDQRGRLGIGVTSPAVRLDIGGSVASSTIGTEDLFHITRGYTGGNSFQQVAAFRVGSFATNGIANGYGPSTRLDINLKSLATNDNVADATIMTLQSNGNVGIGSTAPVGRFIVNHNAYIANLPTTNSHLMDNSTYRPLTRFQVTSGINNNGLSVYATTTAFALQAHNYSIGSALPLILQPSGGNVGVRNNSPEVRFDIGGSLASSTIGTEDLFHITRGYNGGNSFQQVAAFRVGSFATNGIPNGYGPSTRLDINLKSLATNDNVADATIMTLQSNGNVGIGTISPASKLEVNGSATNSVAYNAGALTTIDFSLSNLAYTAASAGAFSLTGIKNGGTYTLAVQGDTSGSSTFSCSGFTFIYVNNGITAPNKDTLYTFIIMGPTVYVYMATGF